MSGRRPLIAHRVTACSLGDADAGELDVAGPVPPQPLDLIGVPQPDLRIEDRHVGHGHVDLPDQVLQALQSTDNTARSQAEKTLNDDWLNQRPDMLLMGLAEQMQGSQDEGVSFFHTRDTEVNGAEALTT